MNYGNTYYSNRTYLRKKEKYIIYIWVSSIKLMMLIKNKNLINDEIKLSRIKSKGGNGDGGRKPGSTNKITLAKLSNKVDTLANNLNAVTNNLNAVTNNLNKLAKVVTDGFNNVNHSIDTIKDRIDTIVRVNDLKE